MPLAACHAVLSAVETFPFVDATGSMLAPCRGRYSLGGFTSNSFHVHWAAESVEWQQSVFAEGAWLAGIVQRRLSNGMKVNYCQTDNEPQAAMVRMVAAGGRAMEGQGPGPSGTGVVSIGTRTLSESGTVGSWRRDQVRLHHVLQLSLLCMRSSC